jgi:hypothetical protein
MSSAATIDIDTEQGISAEDWTAFCHDNGLQHEPQVIGGNAST